MALSDSIGILMRIKANASEVTEARELTEKELKAIQSAYKKVNDDALQLGKDIGDSLKNVGKAFTIIGGGASAFGAVLFKLAKDAADYGSAMYEASQKTGLHVEKLSALKAAGDSTGVTFENIGTALNTFGINIGKANEGSKDAAGKMALLKVTSTDLDTALSQAFTTISKGKTETDQLALASAAFGDEMGSKLIPLIKESHGNIDELVAKYKALGQTLTDDAAAKSKEFGDQLDVLSGQLMGVRNTIGIQLMPVFSSMAKDISGWLADNQAEVQTWAQTFAKGVQDVADTMKGMSKDANEPGGFWDTLKAIDEWITTHSSIYAYGARLRAAAQADRAIGQGFFNTDTNTVNFGNIGLANAPATLPAGGSRGGTIAPLPAKSSTKDDRSDRQVYRDFITELRKVGITINSGFRTYSEQAALFARLPKGQAARPGTSDHEFYRAVDLPAGASQELINLAARRAGVRLDDPFVHEGTGKHNHQAFRKGKFEGGGGEEDAAKQAEKDAKAREKAEKEQKDREEQSAKESIELERETMAERLDIFESAQKRKAALAEEYAGELKLTDRELAEYQESLDTETLAERKRLLTEYIAFLKLAGPDGVEELRKAEQKLKLLEDQIEIDRSKNAVKQQQRNEKEQEALDKRNASWAEYIQHLIEAKEKEDADNDAKARKLERQKYEDASVLQGGGVGQGIGNALGVSLPSIFGEDDKILEKADFMKSVFSDLKLSIGESLGAIAGGIADMVTAWVTGSDISAKAALKMAAGVAIGLAIQSGIKAIFEVAEGFAALAVTFGVPNPASIAHFAAAAQYGIVAGVAGGAGVALGLASRSLSGGSASSAHGGTSAASSYSSVSRNVEGQGGRYSSFGDDAQVLGGNRNRPTERLHITLGLRGDGVLEILDKSVRSNGKGREIILSAA